MGWSDIRPLMGREAYVMRVDAEVLELPDGWFKFICPDCRDEWRQDHTQKFYICSVCGYKWRTH